MDRDQIIGILKRFTFQIKFKEIAKPKDGINFFNLSDDLCKEIADKIKALEPTEKEILKECDIYHEKVIKGWRKLHRAFILGANFVKDFKR